MQLESVADSCPRGLTGADFYALCSDAMLNAVKRKITQIQAGMYVNCINNLGLLADMTLGFNYLTL